jgi:hypothetical protein
MASGGDPGVVGKACVGPETSRVHDWVPVGLFRLSYLVHFNSIFDMGRHCFAVDFAIGVLISSRFCLG